MYSICKSFRHRITTTAAIDACMMGTYFLYLTTSLFRFVCKVIEKLSPASIANRFGKMMISNHTFYIQIFNSDKTAGINYFTRYFMMKIRPLISNLTMKFSNNLYRLLSVSRPFLLFRKLSLLACQLFFRLMEIFWVFYDLAIRKHGKGFKPNIYTYRLIRYRFYLERACLPTVSADRQDRHGEYNFKYFFGEAIRASRPCLSYI